MQCCGLFVVARLSQSGAFDMSMLEESAAASTLPPKEDLSELGGLGRLFGSASAPAQPADEKKDDSVFPSFGGSW